ncbi:hypothetical protein AnigIFM59636_011501 [Aspergillus niger]|uniref:uncharacterized protein n=1 Tax=Aspergillus lacticoffeatus (strain CBS 101883) TaxID=1450533 RepID=UPI000D7F9670|nr:uncharacterized protein BO96DRAFT_495825 [Aspergillus niger CBS 101883]PYH62521.1 hypothetical protein BO96DRAFT_495825 [Aspergillus niger CBS 101883]GJP92699.1 uncharacterized protein AlacWU_05598 [Aspergillus niger]GKZ96981.1 hypothetical protein AnigIFM59636_011501 [Aspergillus niger]
MSIVSTDTTESNYPPETDSSGTVTSYMPLTSVWTASSGCESKFRLDGPSLMAWDPGYMLDIDTNARCCPPQMVTWWEQALLGVGGQYHTQMEIGPFTGPESWPTVASSIKNQYSTLWMCCPSGYFLSQGTVGQVTGRCMSSVYSGQTLTYGSTPLSDHTAWTIATTTLTTDSTVGAIDIVGWEIKYPVTATATAISTSTSTASTSSSTLTSVPSTAEDNTSTSDNSLSAGAKAGIGIGVGVGAVGIIALILALFLFNQRKRLAINSQQPVAAYAYYPPFARNAKPAELPGFRGMPGDAWASSPVEMGER